MDVYVGLALCLLVLPPCAFANDRRQRPTDKRDALKNTEVAGHVVSAERGGEHYKWWQPYAVALVTNKPAERSRDQFDKLHYTSEPHRYRSSNVDDERALPDGHIVIGRLADGRRVAVADRMLGDQPVAAAEVRTTDTREEEASDKGEKKGKKKRRRIDSKGRRKNGGRRRSLKKIQRRIKKLQRKAKRKDRRDRNKELKNGNKNRNKNKKHKKTRVECGENDTCPEGKCCVQSRKGHKFCRKSVSREFGKKCRASCQCKHDLQCFVKDRRRPKATERRIGHCIGKDFVGIGPGHFMTPPSSPPPPERT